MNITQETVTHVANLARLSLAPEEIATLAAEMGSMLAYVDKLNELDTEDIVPTAHAVPLENAFRTDTTRPSPGVEKALQNAPAASDGCFVVPKVIE
ncbi:MAG: Asp-tRNA(Asn)/Glu-tRNA(Gln) amidotransferase subunit GatC [Deltaproteobacteria bacterium]|nr:Asp-tRNA(Asn)/Glu-tRNA(Gln) amidotransferase subunit GatC [Deltaproteobacteria bacterium]